MSGAKIRIAKNSSDVFSSPTADMAFDSDVFLPKVYKTKRVSAGATASSVVSTSHSVSYPPRGLCYVEVDDDPLTVAYARGKYTADSTNVYAVPGTSRDYTTSTDTDNTGVYFLMMLDPLGTPASPPSPISYTPPVVLVGGTDGGPDYDREIHSEYDSLKVAYSGTLTINADAIDYDDTDTHWFSATFDHNLGYIPVFAPFAPYSTELSIYYQWHSQWFSRGNWSTGRQFGPGDFVNNDSNTYECTHFHTSSSLDEPGTGANWEDYWELYDDSVDEWSISTPYSAGTYVFNNYPDWTTSTSYTSGTYVYNDGKNYFCFNNHTSSSTNEPGSGASWTNYWAEVSTPFYYCYTSHTSSSTNEPGIGASWEDCWWDSSGLGTGSDVPEEINVNEMEQERFVFGGAFAFQIEVVNLYVTTTQIVLKYARKGYSFLGDTIAKFPKRTIICDYVIFHNKLNEDWDRLA